MDGRMDIVSFLNQAVSLGVEIAQICDNFNLLELSIDDAVRIVRDFGKRISIQTGFRGHDVKMLEKAILVTNALGGSQMRLIPENTDDKSDVDCIGAAIGIYRAAKTSAKHASIVAEDVTNNVKPLMDRYRNTPEYDEDLFITKEEALKAEEKSEKPIL